MSFDIRLMNGDMTLGSNGDVARVTDSDKLAQDVIKLLNTTVGSDPFNPSYGSLLTSSNIGQTMDNANIISRVESMITQGLETLIAYQNMQRTYQLVTDAETIIDFDPPIVEQDTQEPRQYNVTVNAVSKALTTVTLVMVVRV